MRRLPAASVDDLATDVVEAQRSPQLLGVYAVARAVVLVGAARVVAAEGEQRRLDVARHPLDFRAAAHLGVGGGCLLEAAELVEAVARVPQRDCAA